MAVAGSGDAGAMRKWWIVAAGAVVAATLAWATVEVLRPEEGCGCAVPPQLDHVDQTAERWLTAVEAGDAATAWDLLTKDAQRRHGDVDRLRTELPALAARFGATAATGAAGTTGAAATTGAAGTTGATGTTGAAGTTGRWQEVNTRTQGMNTPSKVFLIRVTSRDGVPAATGGLVVHSNATRADPGRIDPDLGEPIQVGAADPGAPLALPGRVRVANPDGKYLDFLAVPATVLPGIPRLNLAPVRNLGGGLYQIDSSGHPDMTGPSLLIVIVDRPDGRRAFGAVPVTFDTR
jgi:hypothetical protein